MKEISTEIYIHAPIETVWRAILDFDNYPKWNPFITNITGKPTLGGKIAITIEPQGQKPMTFKPKIQNITNYHFSWLGSFIIRGIFDGLHSFKLIQENHTTVKLIHNESFSGLLHKPIFKRIEKSVKFGFEQVNNALKNYCETHS